MTLGMSLVVLGLMSVYQLLDGPVRGPDPGRDPVARLGDLVRLPAEQPRRLRARSRILIVVGLRRSGYGRLLFAVGDNPIAARLAGTRVWQVLLALYIAVGAAGGGRRDPHRRPRSTPPAVSLAEQSVLPSVAAAVIGGTSIMGGRGGYAGTIVGALILTVLTTLLTVLEMPEAVRQVLFGAIIVAVAAAYTRVTGES